MILLRDIAWLAGLLEGEGCFNMSGTNGSARISLNLTDRDIIEKAAQLLGSHINKPCIRSFPLKTVYSTAFFSHRAAAWMMTLYPFLGERRKTAVRNTLAIWRSQRYKNPNGAGRRNPRGPWEMGGVV